jgi:hypothetical protein
MIAARCEIDLSPGSFTLPEIVLAGFSFNDCIALLTKPRPYGGFGEINP